MLPLFQPWLIPPATQSKLQAKQLLSLCTHNHLNVEFPQLIHLPIAAHNQEPTYQQAL